MSDLYTQYKTHSITFIITDSLLTPAARIRIHLLFWQGFPYLTVVEVDCVEFLTCKTNRKHSDLTHCDVFTKYTVKLTLNNCIPTILSTVSWSSKETKQNPLFFPVRRSSIISMHSIFPYFSKYSRMWHSSVSSLIPPTKIFFTVRWAPGLLES